MIIKPSLTGTFMRQALGVTMIALPVMVIFTLFYRGVLEWRNQWASLFVLVHSIMIVFCLGRFRSRSFAYLYTRGYSRDALWFNKMIATAVSVLVVWLPAAAVVWLPVRSVVQDKMFLSPYFPLMMAREATVPFFWLFGYAVLIPLFHYTWIRRAQPTRGGHGAILLAIAVVATAWMLMLFRWHPDWFKAAIWSVSGVMTFAGQAGGLVLHRKVEVQK